MTRTQKWLAFGVVVLAGLARAAAAPPPALPEELTGSIGEPKLAWRVDGVAPGATIGGYMTAGAADLLIGGPRLGKEAVRVGDVGIVSTRSFERRRFVTEHGLAGLPAKIRQVVVAADAGGRLRLWPLTGSGGTTVDLVWPQPMRVGPLVVGQDVIVAPGNTVCAVANLVDKRWTRDLGAPVEVPPTSDGLLVYVAAGQRLYALSVESGEVAWDVPLDFAPSTGLLSTAGLIIAGFEDGAVRAYDGVDGALAWRRQVCSKGFTAELALAGPWVFAASGEGLLVGLETSGGEPQWQRSLPGPLSSPTVAFGHVFVTAADSKLHAVPLALLDEGWSFGLPEERVVGVPCIYGRRVYATTASGGLLAIDLPDATGPASWPVPRGSLQRLGRVQDSLVDE